MSIQMYFESLDMTPPFEKLHLSFNNKFDWNICEKACIKTALQEYYNNNVKFKHMFRKYNTINIVKPIHDTNELHFNIQLFYNEIYSRYIPPFCPEKTINPCKTLHCYIHCDKPDTIVRMTSMIEIVQTTKVVIDI